MTPQIRNAIIVISAILLAVFVGNLAGEQNYRLIAAIIVSGVFLLFLQNPAVPALASICLYYSGLTLPGVPGKLNLFYLSAICLVGIMFLRMMLNRLEKIRWAAAHSFMAAFGLVLVMTILVRGAGFRVLGSGTWGGMFYVQLFICMFLVLALPQVGIRPGLWKLAIIGMGLFSVMPLLADSLILLGVSPGKVWIFVQGSQQIGQSMQAQVEVEEGVVRYFSAGLAGQLLMVAFLARFNLNRVLSFRGLWLIPLPVAFFVITLFGGFRLYILNFVIMTMMVAWFQRALTVGRIFIGVFLMFAGWVVLVKTSPYLPPSAQRAVSWVPGADIPEYVVLDATGTVDWRLELWREGLKNLPKYWLVGKGYAFSEKEAIAVSGANRATDEISWALVTSSYHNGPISLLIGLGVFGLLIGLGLMFAICVRHRRILKADWIDPGLRQCHQVIYAMLLVHVLVFLTIYGDVQVSFPPLFFMFGILEGLRAADLKLANEQLEAAAES